MKVRKSEAFVKAKLLAPQLISKWMDVVSDDVDSLFECKAFQCSDIYLDYSEFSIGESVEREIELTYYGACCRRFIFFPEYASSEILQSFFDSFVDTLKEIEND